MAFLFVTTGLSLSHVGIIHIWTKTTIYILEFNLESDITCWRRHSNVISKLSLDI